MHILIRRSSSVNESDVTISYSAYFIFYAQNKKVEGCDFVTAERNRRTANAAFFLEASVRQFCSNACFCWLGEQGTAKSKMCLPLR